jgi:hypothetical protein
MTESTVSGKHAAEQLSAILQSTPAKLTPPPASMLMGYKKGQAVYRPLIREPNQAHSLTDWPGRVAFTAGTLPTIDW